MNKKITTSLVIVGAAILGFTGYAVAARLGASTGVRLENKSSLYYSTRGVSGCRGVHFPSQLAPMSNNTIRINYRKVKKAGWPWCYATYIGQSGEAIVKCRIKAINKKGQLTWSTNGFACKYTAMPRPTITITASS